MVEEGSSAGSGCSDLVRAGHLRNRGDCKRLVSKENKPTENTAGRAEDGEHTLNRRSDKDRGHA